MKKLNLSERIILIVAVMAIVTIITVIVMGIVMPKPVEVSATEKPVFSKAIEVAVGDKVFLPLAENWTVYVEALWVNKDYYEHWDYGNLSNAEYIVPCDNIAHLGQKVHLWLSTDQKVPANKGSYVVGRSISLHTGGVGILTDDFSKNEYLIFFEEVGKWSNESYLHIRLRVRQL